MHARPAGDLTWSSLRQANPSVQSKRPGGAPSRLNMKCCLQGLHLAFVNMRRDGFQSVNAPERRSLICWGGSDVTLIGVIVEDLRDPPGGILRVNVGLPKHLGALPVARLHRAGDVHAHGYRFGSQLTLRAAN